MDYIFVGKIVNTHGIKGELKIISNFEYKDRVFKINNSLYIGTNKTLEVIKTYRPHQKYDMVTLSNYTNINEVLKYKGQNVYVLRDDLHLSNSEYLYQDLIGLNIENSQQILGKVQDVMYNNGNVLLSIKSSKDFFIPLNEHFIKKVDLIKQTIQVENIEGLIL